MLAVKSDVQLFIQYNLEAMMVSCSLLPLARLVTLVNEDANPPKIRLARFRPQLLSGKQHIDH